MYGPTTKLQVLFGGKIQLDTHYRNKNHKMNGNHVNFG